MGPNSSHGYSGGCRLGFRGSVSACFPLRQAHEITEGASSQAGLPHGAVEGINSADSVGYTGPCPPGAKPHHYVFRLYALDVPLNLPSGKNKEQLAAAVKDHVLAEGQITGLYSRGAQ